MRSTWKITCNLAMVRIHDWKEFDRKSRDLFARDPQSTRYVIKQNTATAEKDGVPKKKIIVTLRVTNDKEVFTFETAERFNVKRIARLTRWFVIRMSSTTDDQLKDQTALRSRIRD
jgi:hypothetical protein